MERHFLPEKAVLSKKFSPEKSSPENIARFLPQKSVLLPASGIEQNTNK